MDTNEEKISRAISGADGKVDIEKLRMFTLREKHPFWYKVALIRKYWALVVLLILVLAWLTNL